MHGVTGLARDYASDDLAAEQRQIANEVEYLVANEFILVTQGAIDHAFASKHDAAIHGSTADEAHFAHGLLVFAKSEGAGRRDFALEFSIVKVDFEAFQSDLRVRKVDLVRNGIAFSG